MKAPLLCWMALALGATSQAQAGQDHSQDPGQNPLSRQSVLTIEHGVDTGEQHPPRPPRTLSPLEFQQRLMQSEHLPVLKSKKAASQALDKQSANLNAVASSCSSASELQGLTGSALVDAVKQGQLTSCLYGLYNVSWVGSGMFSDANLLSIVGAINEVLVGYDGSTATGATELEKLVTFLRAMHWAETSAGSNRQFQAAYKQQLQQAFDSYFGGAHFVQFNGSASRDFMTRYEMLILVNSSGTNRLPYMARFSQALLGYANTVERTDNWGVGYEESGVTQLLTHYYNAMQQQQQDYAQVLATHPEIITNLQSFVMQQGLWLVGHTREYQWSDAVSELGRFLQMGGQIADTVRPSMQSILATYSYDGVGANGWINAQGMVSFYDSANCDLYGNACDFDLEAVVLSGNHVCGSTLKVRFQEPISSENLGQICVSLAGQEQLFHQTFGTNPATPVADDLNQDLEVVIFQSSSDYQNYAGTFFGINTDNGGMYLEGDPAVSGNQARFIAFQATWLQPDFVVWNLEHEYIHYLDGRFNKWGGFGDQPANSVWWGEGVAEYLSQPNTNANALAVAAQGTYDLSELFQTTYANGDTARVYYWGYLAVRYMMENQRVEIDQQLLPSMRAAKYAAGNEGCLFDWQWKAKPEAQANGWYWLYDDSENGYTGSGYWVWTCGQSEADNGGELPEFTPYEDIISDWGNRFDQPFDQWLVCLVAGAGECAGNTNPADLDGNSSIDSRDVQLFMQRLRSPTSLGAEFDFNGDGQVDQRDIRALSGQCDLPRCAIAS